MPLCSFRHSLVSTCNTRQSNIPAESKSCRTQMQFFFLQDLSTQPQGRLGNCALTGEVTGTSLLWFEAISINPGVTLEVCNLHKHPPSSAAHKMSPGFQIMGSGIQPSADPRLQLISAQAQKGDEPHFKWHMSCMS